MLVLCITGPYILTSYIQRYLPFHITHQVRGLASLFRHIRRATIDIMKRGRKEPSMEPLKDFRKEKEGKEGKYRI